MKYFLNISGTKIRVQSCAHNQKYFQASMLKLYIGVKYHQKIKNAQKKYCL